MRRLLVTAAALLLSGTAACGGGSDDPPAGSGADDGSGGSASPSATAAPSPTDTAQPSASASSEPADVPALDWRTVPGPTSATATVGGEWTLTQRPAAAVLKGPEPLTVRAPERHRISHTLLDDSYAVVVAEDDLAEAPDTATVVDLATGKRTVIDGTADVPTTTGGTWALGQGRLVHATIDRGRYCLAEVDLAAQSAEVTWCAPKRHGFSDARISPDGTSLLTFDDSRPSCRTVAELSDGEVTPIAEAPDCTGWDALLVDGATIWSATPNARSVEEATFRATTGEGTVELGPGTSGSLTWCGGAAYFVRDPQRSADPARLIRWTPSEGQSVAYETEARGRAFLSEPRCGGGDLTVSAFTHLGDEQVTASVG